MDAGARHRATEFVKDLYAAGDIGAGRFDAGIAGLLAATSDAELAGVVRSLPAPVALTSPDRRLDRPLEIHSGMRRLRVQIINHGGGGDTRLERPWPGSPPVRLDATTNIGSVRLRHPGTPGRQRRRKRRPGAAPS